MTEKNTNKSALEYFDFRLNNLNFIKDSKGNLGVMKLTEGQKKALISFRKNKRIIWLKSRQEGGTTFGSAVCKDFITFNSNFSALIIAHNRDVQRNAMEKVKLMHKQLINASGKDNIINDGVSRFKIPIDISNNETILKLDNNSELKISLDATGNTYQHIHMSEFAKDINAQQKFQDAIASLNEGSCIIESTAFGKTGKGKWFYDFWRDSVKGLTGFTPVFTPWFNQKRYQHEYLNKPFTEDIEYYRKFLKDYDIDTQNKKLQWYSDLKKQTFKENMPREYPAYPEEAFTESSVGVFDNMKIQELLEQGLYYEYSDKFGKKIDSKGIENGLRIFRDPTDNMVIAIDPAGGNENGDYTAIVGRDLEHNLLFTYYGKAGPDMTLEIIQELDELGYYGVIVPEENATNGGAVLTLLLRAIQDLEIRSKMYIRTRSKSDIRKGKQNKYGFNTNTNTRKNIIEFLLLIFGRNTLNEIDDRQLHEMANFIKDDKGKYIASLGEHDDLILCDAICNYAIDNYIDDSIITIKDIGL